MDTERDRKNKYTAIQSTVLIQNRENWIFRSNEPRPNDLQTRTKNPIYLCIFVAAIMNEKSAPKHLQIKKYGVLIKFIAFH